MKIIVNNQQEADLIRHFLSECHEYSIMDLLKNEIAKYQDDEAEIQGEDFRILEEAVFWSGPKIIVDPQEEELEFEDDNWVTGECIHCGTHTMGSGDDRPLTYAAWRDMDSDESRAQWRCEDCSRRLCPACSERLKESDEGDECKVCLGEEQQP